MARVKSADAAAPDRWRSAESDLKSHDIWLGVRNGKLKTGILHSGDGDDRISRE